MIHDYAQYAESNENEGGTDLALASPTQPNIMQPIDGSGDNAPLNSIELASPQQENGESLAKRVVNYGTPEDRRAQLIISNEIN